MWQTAYEYFILYKQLSIPGVGSFKIEPLVARLDFANKLLHAPLPAVRFSHDEQSADKNFYEYVSHQFNISETEAIKRYHDFCYELQQDIESKGNVELKGIGILKKEFSKTYSFQPSNETDRYFPDVKVERVIRKDSRHLIRVGEDQRTNVEMEEMLSASLSHAGWKKAAIILAIIGVVLIALYYLTQ
jgi:hypothetical protein